ncbi:MAG: hypothetical protein U5N85_04965 [Arcicella sp.]|nr:hypothetical protein [Arcicella sp.]
MIRINKKTEPIEWTKKKLTPNFTKYSSIPELRDALLEEQGFICAYCMRSIPVKDFNEAETSKIEHIKSRSDLPDLQLDYNNMIICCPGSINGSSHCDKSKGHRSLSFSLFDISVQSSIVYGTKDGKIKSANATIDDEISSLLSLNNAMLKANRKETLSGILTILEKKKWKKAQIELKLVEWNKKENQRLKPYCGVVIWYLEKKLRQY